MPAADAELAPRVTRQLLDDVLALVPDEWLEDDEATAADCRRAVRRPAAGPAGRARRLAARTGRRGRDRRERATARAARREPAGLARPAAAGRGHPAMRNDAEGRAMRDTFEYAVLRVVPRVERGEALNAGVLVYCRQRDYLGSRVHLDVDRLPRWTRPPTPRRSAGRCRRPPTSARPSRRRAGRAGDAGLAVPLAHRARSTVVQPGPVHTGLTEDPDAEADRLLRLLVLPSRAELSSVNSGWTRGSRSVPGAATRRRRGFLAFGSARRPNPGAPMTLSTDIPHRRLVDPDDFPSNPSPAPAFAESGPGAAVPSVGAGRRAWSRPQASSPPAW